jgi:hypothetical protein
MLVDKNMPPLHFVRCKAKGNLKATNRMAFIVTSATSYHVEHSYVPHASSLVQFQRHSFWNFGYAAMQDKLYQDIVERLRLFQVQPMVAVLEICNFTTCTLLTY